MWRFMGFLLLPLVLMGLITMPGKDDKDIEEKNGNVNVDNLIKRINALNEKNEHKQSLELLISALDKQQEDSLLRPILLQTFDMFLENEIRSGEDAIKNNYKNIEAYIRTASALELLDQRYRALEILINGISLNNNSAELWMKIGKLEHKSERHLEAFDVFKEVIRLDPKNSDAYNNAAFVLAKAYQGHSKDLEEASTFAHNAHKLDPDNPEYIDTMAEIEYGQGNYIQAQNLIKQAIKLAPDKDFFKNQLKRFSQ
jgi:tetratricopeptide (TPR) repeat protein